MKIDPSQYSHPTHQQATQSTPEQKTTTFPVDHPRADVHAIGLGENARDIECPYTGEIYAPDDIDGLIDLYERAKHFNDQAYSVQIAARVALAALTEGAAKTRRLQGERRKCVVEMPSDTWEQRVLKELWQEFPKIAEKYLRIETIGVRLTEFKKLVNTSSNQADLIEFRNRLSAACRGATGTPTVKLEK